MLSDWESSLTELSSDEDEYVPQPAAKKAPRKPPKNNEYMVTAPLSPYRTTTYTAKSLYDQIIDNTIHLSPEYQRDIVWTEAKQSGLIDSVLRNFYIPPVIFSVTTYDDGSQTRVCIDGKQRLTSIQLFMDGLIAHKDVVTNKKYWYKAATGEKRLLISKHLMQSFANKQITCIEYDSVTEDQEREIFQRVQLGVALTAAERMQAIPGPWPSLIREVQSIVLGDEGFGEDLDWGHDRGRDFQCLATILCLINNHPSTTFPGAAKLEKWLMTTSPVKAKVRADILDTFKIFIALVKDKKYTTAFQKPSRVSPVEFTMTGVLIYLYKHSYSLKQLSSAIWQMRADVRKQFIDIRANSKVTKVMFDFLKKGLKDAELASDGKGDLPAAVVIKQMKSVGGLANGAVKSKDREVKETKKSRKRQLSLPESSNDSEYEPTPAPPKRRVSMPQGSTSRSSASKAGASKSTTARKVSAPAAPKASTSQLVGNIPRSSAISSHAETTVVRSSPLATQDLSLTAKPTGVANLTSRTTRTAMSAAADAIFPPPEPSPSNEATAANPPASALEIKIPRRPPVSEQASPVVKMEVDPPSLNNVLNENTMVITKTESVSGANTWGHQSYMDTGAHSSAAASVQVTKLTEQQPQAPSRMSVNIAQSSPAVAPTVPVPPPPPSITSPPALGSLSAGPPDSANLPPRPPMSLSRRPSGTVPTGPRSDRDWERDRSRRNGSYVERSRDRNRDRDRDRYDYRSSGRDGVRERERERLDSWGTRDWESETPDWARRERSRDRDGQRGRYPDWQYSGRGR